MNDQTRAVVSVTEMAQMVGLSRQRLYQLMGTTFPWPLYDVATRRPFYNEELQKVCLEVRQRNFGIDGKPVMFYAKGHRPNDQPKSTRKARPKPNSKYADILDAVIGLGLISATSAQIESAVRRLFPTGTADVHQAEIIRTVFIHLKRSARD